MPKKTVKEIKPYTLKSGAKRYYFKTYLGLDSNGRAIKTTRKGFKTYTEALEQYNLLRAQSAQTYTKPMQIKTKDLWKLWFDTYQDTVKESTVNLVASSYKLHINPFFGNRYIDQITPASLQRWVQSLAKEMTMFKVPFNIFNNLFKYAIALGYLKTNPLDKVIVPKSARKQVNRISSKDNFYNKDELDEFLKTAKSINLQIYTFFLLLASTGIRRGEALGLVWSDLDFKKQELHISRTVTIGLNNKVIVQTPKTKASIRTIPMTDKLTKTLKEYKTTYNRDDQRVFPRVRGGYYWQNPGSPTFWLRKIYNKNKSLKKITTHGFRHTFATLLIENTDINLKEVQKLLGHERIEMTLQIYTHATKKDHATARNKIASLKI